MIPYGAAIAHGPTIAHESVIAWGHDRSREHDPLRGPRLLTGAAIAHGPRSLRSMIADRAYYVRNGATRTGQAGDLERGSLRGRILATLTAREREALILAAGGLSNWRSPRNGPARRTRV